MATFRPIKRTQEEDSRDHPAKRARTDPFKLTASIPKGSLRCYEYKPEECAVMDIPSLFTEVYTALIALLLTELGKQQYKCSLIVQLAFYKPFNQTTTDWACPYFQSKPMVILREEDIEPFLADAHAQFEKHVDKFTKNGSGWTLESVMSLSVNIAKYTPLKGASYIDLPAYLKRKKAIINVRNYDQHCLKWALLSALHPVKKDPQRLKKYMHFKELKFTGVDFPVPLSQMPKVERLNNLAINVFGYSQQAGIHPLYLTKDLTRDPINLLLITKVEDGKTNSHYCWIKDFNRLCHDQTLYEHRKFFCLRCISPHCSERTLQDHLVYCRGVDAAPCHAVFPQASEDGLPPTIQFKNIQHLMKAPYVIYADTESIIKPTDNPGPNTDTNTVQTSEHVPCSFAYTVVRSDGKVVSEQLYRGEDCMDVFFEQLEGELDEIREDLKHIRPMNMTQDDREAHDAADKCWLCGGVFKEYEQGDTEGLWKVRDHDHLTGKYRGAAHSKCNLTLRIDPYHTPIPIFFHNLKNYDSHHIISAIGRTEKKVTICTDKNGEPLMHKDREGKTTDKPVTVTDGGISGICQNMEKLISFSWGQFRFVDSFAFLSSSLDRLVTNTPKEDLQITRKPYYYPWARRSIRQLGEKKFDLVTRKGVYPYEYMDSFDRFDETELPTQVIH